MIYSAGLPSPRVSVPEVALVTLVLPPQRSDSRAEMDGFARLWVTCLKTDN